MKYRVIIWCPDCTGIDYQGCFDGGSEEVFLDVDGSVAYEYMGVDIISREQAELLGDLVTYDSIWQYDIEEIKPLPLDKP